MKLLPLVLIVGAIVVSASLARADTTATPQPTSVPIETKVFAGVGSVYLWFDDVPAPLVADGLMQSQIKTDVELHLRRNGIPLVDDPAQAIRPAVMLCVSVKNYVVDDKNVFDLVLETKEFTYLQRPTLKRALTTTWSYTTGGFATDDTASDFIRKHLADMIDTFSNDFLADNAKLPTSK